MPGVWEVLTVFNSRDVHPGCASGVRQAIGSFDPGGGRKQDVDEVGGNMLLRSWAVNRPGLFDETPKGHGNRDGVDDAISKDGRTHRRSARGSRLIVGRSDLQLTSRLRRGHVFGRQRACLERAAGQRVSTLAHLAKIPRSSDTPSREVAREG